MRQIDKGKFIHLRPPPRLAPGQNLSRDYGSMPAASIEAFLASGARLLRATSYHF